MRKRSKKFSLGDTKMVNEKALERIRVLEKKYKENWGKDEQKAKEKQEKK